MKNVLSYVGIILLITFSFFITEKLAVTLKESDPLLQELRSKKDEYQKNTIEAIITDNTIIPGVEGCEVDIEKSYENMKKIGSFTPTMIKYKKIIPKNKLNDNLDKYIISGNKEISNVSLLFKLYNNISDKKINNLIKILKNMNVSASIFVDGNYLENNGNKISTMIKDNIEILNMGYNNKYDENLVKWDNTILNELNYNNPKICYLESFSINDITICKLNNMKTVIPNIIIEDNPLTTVKSNLDNGSIISFDITDSTINELKLIINYINNKGYKIVKLSNLLREDNDKCNK